jgi:hypothetical protein
MMVGTALVSVVEQPDISNIGDLVVRVLKEWLEILCRLNKLWKPNKRGQVSLSSLNVGAGELDLVGMCDSGSLCNKN